MQVTISQLTIANISIYSACGGGALILIVIISILCCKCKKSCCFAQKSKVQFSSSSNSRRATKGGFRYDRDQDDEKNGNTSAFPINRESTLIPKSGKIDSMPL